MESVNTDGDASRGLNIVIFEGGVAGGLSSLLLFRALIEKMKEAGGNVNIEEWCELMAGTGTGALIACMLGLLGMDVDSTILAYTRLIQKVFSDPKIISKSASGAYKASKLEGELKQIVRAVTGDENTHMIGEKKCKVMVFAMSEHTLDASIPRIIRSYKGTKNPMPDCPIWQAIRASMAHPELFKSFAIHDGVVGESLIGGDVGCSNPTRHVLAEVGVLYPSRHVSSIICIGAGHARTIQIPKPNIMQRVMPTNLLVAMRDVATDCERVAQEMAAQFEDGTNVYWRFSVDQGMQSVRTSQWQRMDEVVGHTRSYLHKTGVQSQLQAASQAMVKRTATIEAKYIGGKVQKISKQQATGYVQCPAPSALFTGYEQKVSQVIDCISGGHERRVCVIHGLGGTGKTQIALKAIERTLDQWVDIVYVDATSRDTAESALGSFASIKSIGDTWEDAVRWLGTSREPWLLVFDNADDPSMVLRDFIPRGTHGSVMITTRLRAVGQLGQGPGADCHVSRMETDDAVDLLLKKARLEIGALAAEEKEEAALLVEDLGRLALAIVHSGAYIWCTGTSIAKYRKQCHEHTQSALEAYSRWAGNAEQYTKTVYTTWVMSYERLSARTQQLLWLLSYLHHSMIKEEIFERAAGYLEYNPEIDFGAEDETAWACVKNYLRLFLDSNQRWDSAEFSKPIEELRSYSLIDYDRLNDAYSLHVLVQDWSRGMAQRLQHNGQRHASHLLALSIGSSNDVKAISYRRGLVAHVNILTGRADTVDANDAAYFARVLDENGLWKNSKPLHEQVLSSRKQELGLHHPSTLTSMSNLASTYWQQGRWDKAEVLQVEVLDIRRQELGNRHPNTLTSMNNLASTYWQQGRWDKAEVLQVEVLDIRRQELGNRHPDTLTSMSNLASTYSKQGRWDKAEVLQVEVLDIRRQELGNRHPNTLTSMNNLASTYWQQGRWDKAEVLEVEVLDICRQELGNRHPDTLTSMSNLASTYWQQGRWDKAEVLQVEALDISKQELGNRHPDTLTSMSNLASTYRRQGRWDKAEVLEVEALDISKRELGNRHPNTLTSMSNLASTYWQQGRWDKAEVLEVEVLDICRQELGNRHPDTLTSMNNLASTYWQQGRWDKAEVLQVEVLDISKQELGNRHPDTLTSMSNLASTYSKQGRWDKAEVLQVEALDISKQELGNRHPDTLTRMSNLASTYSKQGRWDKAEVLQVEVLDIRRQELGNRHPNTLTSMSNLASTYWQQGRWDKAEVLQVEALDISKQELGNRHPDTLTSMNNLALTYLQQGRWDKAEVLEVEALDISKQELGNRHPNTLTSMNNLASTYWQQGRWDKAEVLQVEALDISKQELGNRHPNTLTSMYNLAQTYQSREKWDNAELLLLETVAANKVKFGECHCETLDALKSLAKTYQAFGEQRRAELAAVEVEITRVEMSLG